MSLEEQPEKQPSGVAFYLLVSFSERTSWAVLSFRILKCGWEGHHSSLIIFTKIALV